MTARKVTSPKTNDDAVPETQTAVPSGVSVNSGIPEGEVVEFDDSVVDALAGLNLPEASPNIINWSEFDKRQTPRELRRLYAEAPKGYKIYFASAPNGQINPSIYQNLYQMGYRLVSDGKAVANDQSEATRRGAIYAPNALFSEFKSLGYCWMIGDAVMMICREDMYRANEARFDNIVRRNLGTITQGKGQAVRVEDPSGRLSAEDPDGFTQVSKFFEKKTTEPLRFQ